MQLVSCQFLLPTHHARGRLKYMSRFVLLAATGEDYLGLGRLVIDGEGQGLYWEMQTGETLPLEAVTHWAWLSKASTLIGRAGEDGEALFDDDGYPSNYAHRQLRLWNTDDPLGWFRFAERLWHFKDFFHIEEETDKWVVHASTAGWSGNEGLLRSMKQHEILWSSCWDSNRRGGHYIFEIRKEG